MIPQQEEKHFILSFILSKKLRDKTKERLISDCRELNGYFAPQKFRLEHMGHIFHHLKKGRLFSSAFGRRTLKVRFHEGGIRMLEFSGGLFLHDHPASEIHVHHEGV